MALSSKLWKYLPCNTVQIFIVLHDGIENLVPKFLDYTDLLGGAGTLESSIRMQNHLDEFRKQWMQSNEGMCKMLLKTYFPHKYKVGASWWISITQKKVWELKQIRKWM